MHCRRSERRLAYQYFDRLTGVGIEGDAAGGDRRYHGRIVEEQTDAEPLRQVRVVREAVELEAGVDVEYVVRVELDVAPAAPPLPTAVARRRRRHVVVWRHVEDRQEYIRYGDCRHRKCHQRRIYNTNSVVLRINTP